MATFNHREPWTHSTTIIGSQNKSIKSVKHEIKYVPWITKR